MIDHYQYFFIAHGMQLMVVMEATIFISQKNQMESLLNLVPSMGLI